MNISDMSVVPVSTQSYVKSSAEPSQEQINFFEQLLKDEASTSNASALLPQVMLTRQMDYMQLTVASIILPEYQAQHRKRLISWITWHEGSSYSISYCPYVLSYGM